MQRAPTGFNTQPYACVLVREQKDREKLAEAMMDSNARKVKEAPVVAVFAADCGAFGDNEVGGTLETRVLIDVLLWLCIVDFRAEQARPASAEAGARQRRPCGLREQYAARRSPLLG